MTALIAGRPSPLWLFTAFAAATALWLAAKPVAELATQAGKLPWIVCSTAGGEATAPRPRSVVTTLQSEPSVAARGKYVTVQLVHMPPMALSPPHVHGGDVTAYVIKGMVRSEHAGLPLADYHAGETFYEPFGTTHAFFENPSPTEGADVLAITVHDEGAALTTILP
jgi:quercetin dioxygenase-like cupin family protein